MASFLVVGATGATGKAVLKELLSGRSEVGTVVTIGRRNIGDDVRSMIDASKLDEIVVESLDVMSDETIPQRVMSKGPIDVAFCCLGTTRAAAGSAEAFKKVDVEYVDSAATLAKSCGAKVFGLVSAQGASKNVWASDWKPFHGLLYAKCKGIAEESVIQKGFEHTIIMRPGLLDRQENARFGEKLFKGIMPTIRTSDLARVMINESISKLPLNTQGDVKIYEMKEIQSLSRATDKP